MKKLIFLFIFLLSVSFSKISCIENTSDNMRLLNDSISNIVDSIATVIPDFAVVGTTYYVATNGSDSRTLTDAQNPSTPWVSLYKACSTVTTVGSTISVAAGTYTEPNRCYLSPGVNLIGSGRSTTTITLIYNYTGGSPESNGNLQLASTTPNTAGNQTISGITFDGNSWNSKTGIVILNRSNVSVHDVTIRNFYWGGIQFYNSGITTYNENNSLYNSTITDCGTRDIGSVPGGGALNFKCQKGLRIHDNVFYNAGRASGLNGNIVKNTSGYCEDVKFYNNVCTKPMRDGGQWNFHMEIWDVKGGYEYYGNIFNGGECVLDISSPSLAQGAIGHRKGTYDYSHYIHNNTFQFASKYPAPAADGNMMCIQFEDCYVNDVIVAYNHFLRIPQPIVFTMGSNDAGPYNNFNIYGNIFEDIGYANSASSTCVYFRGDATNEIYNNIKFDNNVMTSGPSGTVQSAFLITTVASINGLHIRNNIIENCTSAWLLTSNYFGSGGKVYNLVATNNLFYNNGNNNALSDPTGMIDNATKVINNLTPANPNFISSNNFHLNVGSPAIGSGLNVGLVYDYDGIPWNDVPSIGAYEYVPVTRSTLGKLIKSRGKLIIKP